MKLKPASFLVLAGLVTGCATVATQPAPVPAPPPAPAPAPEPAAVQLPDSVHWFRNSAEYRAVAVETYRAAAERLEAIVQGGISSGAWAVALDADETVLDNSPYQKERALQGLGYSRESWQAWVERKEALPIPGSVVFLTRVHELGGKIAIVTNRAQEDCPETEDNFRDRKIPYDVILCQTDTGDKGPRWKMVEEGKTAQGLPPLRILLWIGDNILDFPGVDQSLRTRPEDAYKDFGVCFFVIPNPMYGSWQRNPRE